MGSRGVHGPPVLVRHLLMATGQKGLFPHVPPARISSSQSSHCSLQAFQDPTWARTVRATPCPVPSSLLSRRSSDPGPLRRLTRPLLESQTQGGEQVSRGGVSPPSQCPQARCRPAGAKLPGRDPGLELLALFSWLQQPATFCNAVIYRPGPREDFPATCCHVCPLPGMGSSPFVLPPGARPPPYGTLSPKRRRSQLQW